MNKIYSYALLILSLLNGLSLQARRRSGRKSVYRKPCPLVMPTTMPSINDIAKDILKPIDAKAFMIGVSTSEHQCSTQCTPEICSWSRWAEQNKLPQPKSYSMDWWHNFKQYIDDAQNQYELNSLRFSIEMALVQPHGPKKWDSAALDHYAELFIYCIKKGITRSSAFIIILILIGLLIVAALKRCVISNTLSDNVIWCIAIS